MVAMDGAQGGRTKLKNFHHSGDAGDNLRKN